MRRFSSALLSLSLSVCSFQALAQAAGAGSIPFAGAEALPDTALLSASSEAKDSPAPSKPDMSGLLVAMSDELFPVLTRSQRIELVSPQGERKVQSVFEGTSVLDTISADYARISLSEVSSLECRTYKTPKDDILAIIHTVRVDSLPDSQLTFVNVGNMEALPLKKLIKEPDPQEFFDFSKLRGEEARKIGDAFGQIPFFCIGYRFNDTGDLEAYLPLKELVNRELYNELDPFLRPEPLLYRWTGKNFRR